MLDKIFEYAQSHTSPEPAILAKLNRDTHLTQVYPQMLAGHLQGAFLRMVCQMIQPQHVLEIGTFTGYSAISMALGFANMHPSSHIQHPASSIQHPVSSIQCPISESGMKPVLHTIEVNPELEDGIRKYVHEAGLDDHIVLHIGEALKIISTLEEIWDLVFIDADKPNYLNYYNMIFPRVRPGGFIIADNVLWDGKVVGDPETMDRDTRGIVEFNAFVHQDPRVENLLLPIRDGLLVARKCFV